MKKIIFIAVLFSSFFAKAQDGQWHVGANLGIPLGNASTTTSFVLSEEVEYMFELSDALTVGPSVAYSSFFGKKNMATSTILPFSFASLLNLNEKFFLGANFGYAFGVRSVAKGSIYFKPNVTYIVSNAIYVNGFFAYTENLSNAGIGVKFLLN